MKRWRLPVLAAIFAGSLVWFFATPGKHDRAVRTYETAQIGDSRAIGANGGPPLIKAEG